MFYKQGLEDVATWAFQLEKVLYQMEEMGGGVSYSGVSEKLKGRFGMVSRTPGSRKPPECCGSYYGV